MKRLNYILILILIFSCTRPENKSTITVENQIPIEIDTTTNEKPLVSEDKEPTTNKIDLVDDSLANQLIKLYNQIQIVDSSSRKSLEKEFFELFPSDFNEYKDLFGFVDSKAMPLYGENGLMIVLYFYKLNSIDKNIRYNKYLDIAENGIWNADCEQDFVLGKLLISDTKDLCHVISKRSDKEIKSILHFIYDGPHPEDPGAMKLYQAGLDSVIQYDPRVADLMKATYETLLKKSDGHGH